MNKTLFLLAAVAASSAALAQEVGRVISSTPVLEQVAVPRNMCQVEQVSVQQPKSGAGALMGAIAGGAMGNAVGDGNGRALATAIGLFGGAIMGDRLEGSPASHTQNVQRCATQTFYENRVAGYNVVYEYAGKQHHVRLPQDPGPTISLNVTPVGAVTSYPAPMPPLIEEQVGYAQPVYSQPVYSQPMHVYTQRVIVNPPVTTISYGTHYYPRARPAYPAIVIGTGIGVSRHWDKKHRHHPGHRR